MLKESPNKHNKNTYSENTDIAKQNIVCKDGFCSLPNKKENSKKDKNDLNFFDPIL